MIKIFNKKKNGYAVLELIFYISFFAVLSLVVINSMIIMTRAFRETTIQAEFIQGGTIMERMSREIRQAYNIDPTSTSTHLKLNTKDSAGVNKNIEFKFVNPNIEFWDTVAIDMVNIGNLNSPNIVVTGLTFTPITTNVGKAVRIVLTFRSNNDKLNRVVDFYDTVVLRGIY